MTPSPPIQWNYQNMMADRIGAKDGITEEEYKISFPWLKEVYQNFIQDRTVGRVSCLDLPYADGVVEQVTALAKEVRGQSDFFLVLGIGGSALGGIAIQRALYPVHYNLLSKKDRGGGPKIFFIENIDPDEIASLLDVISLGKTTVNVVSKSGETLETLAQFLLIENALCKKIGKRAASTKFIITTDPTAGTLRKIAEKEGYRTLDIPEGVGGRFSVFTPVGLLPAAVSGVDIRQLLSGANDLNYYFNKCSLEENGALMGGFFAYLSVVHKRRNIQVIFPYSERLVGVAGWWCQLWAESLGKARNTEDKWVWTGETPISARGVSDQHSQLQLYMEGPYDKTIQFVRVESVACDLPFPRSRTEEAFRLFSDHTLGGLLRIEQEAIEATLTTAGRPNCRITLPRLDAYSLGALLYFFQYQTVLTAMLHRVNPFDQPGVEVGKMEIRKRLGIRKK